METLKNFTTGFVIAIIALTLLLAGILLWPLILGMTSIALFVAIIVVAVILAFYIIVLIGYIVRKGFRQEKPKRKS